MIKPLTSLRFFFAFMVFAHHIKFVNPGNTFFYTLYNHIFFEGYIGVSFFFILSGFVLALNYKNAIISGNISSKKFWIGRIARIYPLHLLTLLAAIPLSLNGTVSNSMLWFSKLILNLFLLQSFIPNPDYYFSFNMPSWSISDELFFYLLFPSVIILFFKKRLISFSWFLIFLIPLAMYFSPSEFYHSFFYINPVLRIVDFTIGILLYDLYQKNRIGFFFRSRQTATVLETIAVIIFILFYTYHRHVPRVYRYSCYYWLPMVLIILCFAYHKGLISALLSNKILVLLGEISFGFYMFHQLVIRYILNLNSLFLLTANDFILIAVIFTITLTVSYFSYRFVERPCNRYIKKYVRNSSNAIVS